MKTSQLLSQYQAHVEPHYQRWFKKWQRHADTLGPITSHLFAKMVQMYPRGKQLRGALTVLGYELAGKPVDTSILQASVAIELFQTVVLIADDIFDQDDTRRGYPTLHRQWENEPSLIGPTPHYGHSMAMITTIIGLQLAPLLLINLKIPKRFILNALEQYFLATADTGYGEALDISTSFQALAQKQAAAQHIHEYKTVRYTTVLPLKLGVTLAGVSDTQWLTSLEHYARALGQIFQMQDDILGSFGNESQTGKAASSDIKEARWTSLCETLFRQASAADLTRLTRLYSQPHRTPAEIEEIKQFMVGYQVKESIQKQAHQLLQKGLGYIPKLTTEVTHQDTLKSLLSFMLERTK